MNRIVVRGRDAEVRWGYHRAASVQQWELTGDSTGGTVTGTVTEADAFKVTQQPLTFVVPRQSGRAWSWAIESLLIVGSTLTGRVSLQER